MQINKNTVVTFHYDLSKLNGDKIESSRDGEPTLALIGAGGLMPGFEQAFIGKSSGDHFEITLEPQQAYGTRKENQVRRVSAKYLRHEGKLRRGQVVRLDSDQGIKVCTVVKVGKFSVDVDTNHPLAGETIHYQVDIIDLRAATDEEIAHGHAHGVGGHQH